MKSSISKRQLQKALHVLQDYSKEVDELEAKVLEKSLFDENKIWISEVFQQVKSLVSGENNLSVLKENDLEEVPVLLPKTRKGKKKAPNKVSEEAIVEEKEIEDSSSNEKKGIEQKSPTFTKPMVQVSDDTKKSLRDLKKDNINNEPSLRCLKSSSEIDSRSIHEGNLPEQNSERDSISSVEIESCPKYEDTLPGQNNKNDSVKSAEIDSRSIHEDTLPEQNNIRDSINSADIDNGSIHEDTMPEQNSKKDSICSADSQSRSIHEDTLSEENSKRESLSSAVIDSQSIHEDTLSKENSKRDSISSAEIDNCSINEGTLPEQNINCNTTFNVPSNSHIEKQASNILIDSNQSTRSIIQSKDKSHSTTPSSSKISSKVNVKDPPKENVAPSSNNNNALYPHLSVKELTSREETDIKKSKSATNQEEKDKRKSARRSSLCQYKGLVNKAIRTSISAEQKKNKTNEDRENVIFNKYSTPLNETRKIPRTVSATTSSGMKTSTLPRTHSLLRHRSPYPIKMPSVISSSSKSFLSSKSVSRHITRTGNGPSNIARGVTTLLPLKPSKPTADELKLKAEQEALRKRHKEEDAIRRKDELAKQKIEDKKALREARLKKVMENKRILERQLSSTDLRKPEIKTKIIQGDIRERQEMERVRAKITEIHPMKQQKEQTSITEHKSLQPKEIVANKLKTQQEANAQIKETQAVFQKPKPMLNVTITKEEDTATNSYDMTLAPEECPPKPLKDEDNYDVADLKSDDDTDDEDQPKKAIPKWASSSAFRQAIVSQTYQPPDIDQIFDVPPMPDLNLMFPLKKHRFFKRTSSAVWNKAPISHSYY